MEVLSMSRGSIVQQPSTDGRSGRLDGQRAIVTGAGFPQRRPGQPEEIAAMNLWLCTQDASYVCGAFLTVDGGRTSV
jgi:NAD(P)-dependent dehydrogenase (short-subunit alcohol dehydrogenase family)